MPPAPSPPAPPAAVGSEGENASFGVASTIIRDAWDAIERSGWLASGTAVARGPSSRGGHPGTRAAKADVEAFARAGGRGSASSAGGPRDRLAPAAASSCLLRRARVAAASAPPVAAGRGLAPGDIATESGTSESGTSSASAAAAAAAAATASTGAASPPAEDSVSVGALLCGNVDGMYEHITSAGVHPGNVGGTSVSARSARPPGSEGPEGRSEGRDDCFVAASNEDVFGDSEGAAAVSGTPSRLSALSAGAESGKGDVAATATFALAPSARARPPGGVLNPAEAAAAVHSDPGVSAAGATADSRLGSVAAGGGEAQKRRRRTTGDREGAGEGRWHDGAGEAVVGTSPASPTPTSSSSGAICVPPASSSVGVFFVVRSVIRRYRLDLRPANRPVAGVLLVLLVFPLGYGRAILERRRLSDVRLRLS